MVQKSDVGLILGLSMFGCLIALGFQGFSNPSIDRYEGAYIKPYVKSTEPDKSLRRAVLIIHAPV